ncbi:MAG: carbamoyltransferase N-terminal domain-containing protein [Thermoanaerobaculia bacterium]
MSRILGLSAFHPDAAVAAVRDGEFVAGVEEERFRRVKHWAGFPELALRWSANELGGDAKDLAAVAVARQPRAYALRKAWLAVTHPRSLRRAVSRVKNLTAVSSLEGRVAGALGLAKSPPIVPVEHHRAHLASAFFCSPFEEAACLSVDGFGDFVSTMLAHGKGNRIEVLERVHYPHSLGIFYSAMTQYLGFPNFGDEYKVMGLAAYGAPRLASEVAQLVPAVNDTVSGTFRLDLRYFRHLAEGVDMTWASGQPSLGKLWTPAFAELLGPARDPGEELTQRHMDLAASMQAIYEERFFALVRRVLARTGSKRLALAGGCALNSLANGRIFDRTGVKEIFIQSAAGDAGTSLGAALSVHHEFLGRPRTGFVMEHSSWGPRHGEQEVRAARGGDSAGERRGRSLREAGDRHRPG